MTRDRGRGQRGERKGKGQRDKTKVRLGFFSAPPTMRGHQDTWVGPLSPTFTLTVSRFSTTISTGEGVRFVNSTSNRRRGRRSILGGKGWGIYKWTDVALTGVAHTPVGPQARSGTDRGEGEGRRVVDSRYFRE